MTVYMCHTFKTFRHFENDSLLDQAFYGYRLSSRDTLISTLVNYNFYSSKITHDITIFIDKENFPNYNVIFLIYKPLVYYSVFLNGITFFS